MSEAGGKPLRRHETADSLGGDAREASSAENRIERGGFLLFLALATLAFLVIVYPFAAPILWTALAASDATWALYNGLIAYLLIGALVLGERLLRPRHGH